MMKRILTLFIVVSLLFWGENHSSQAGVIVTGAKNLGKKIFTWVKGNKKKSAAIGLGAYAYMSSGDDKSGDCIDGSCNKDQLKAQPALPSGVTEMGKVLNYFQGDIQLEILECYLAPRPHSLKLKYRMKNVAYNYGFAITINGPIEEPFFPERNPLQGAFIHSAKKESSSSDFTDLIEITSKMKPFNGPRNNCAIAPPAECNNLEQNQKLQCVTDFFKDTSRSMKSCDFNIIGNQLDLTFTSISKIDVNSELKQKIKVAPSGLIIPQEGGQLPNGTTVKIKVRCGAGGYSSYTPPSSNKKKKTEPGPVDEPESKDTGTKTFEPPVVNPPVVSPPVNLPPVQNQGSIMIPGTAMPPMPQGGGAPQLIIDVSPGML